MSAKGRDILIVTECLPRKKAHACVGVSVCVYICVTGYDPVATRKYSQMCMLQDIDVRKITMSFGNKAHSASLNVNRVS